ncbi:hypothetical protein RF11_03337 [Thelohanellus kitauei]|uniref:Paraneoplastic antigen Ma-like C-terminal domain-containing protein n=1 Tax=Thelohanellus kitauei TaxID=669202 RepID=A0A0C2J6N9_THEKT|nr:hypothetical protein RF11_03337 [Thelohanellus kitauei]
MATSTELTLLQALSIFKDFKFEEFKVGSEDWVDYLDRFYRTVKLRGLDETSTHADVVKRELLFVSLGSAAFKAIKDCAGGKLDLLTYGEIVSIGETIFGVRRNPYVERAKFANCVREKSEDIQAFVKRLKTAAAHCHFGSSQDERL